MKPIGIVYIIVGAIAVLGAMAAGFIALTLGQALGIINNADPSQLPPGTDAAALQQSAASLSLMLTLGWIWIVTVVISGAVSIYYGLKLLKSKK